MAKGTSQVKYESSDTANSTVRSYLCSAKETKEIYYQFEDESEEEEAQPLLSTSINESPSVNTAKTTPAVIAPISQPRQSVQIEYVNHSFDLKCN